MKRTILSVLITLLIATVAFAGGESEPEAVESTAENVMIAALDNGPGGNGGTGSIPYSVGAGHTLTSKMYTPLTNYDEMSENIVPYGASSWSSNADKTVWTFVIDEDLKWSDGKDVTANDVQFTIEFVTDPSWVAQVNSDRTLCWGNLVGYEAKIEGTISELDSVRVISDKEIEFTLATPDPRYFAKMYRAYILPEHAIDFAPGENLTTDWWFGGNGNHIGSGPFYITDYRKDDYLELSPNEYYMDGKPKLDKLVCKFFSTDETAALLALAAGDIDFSFVQYADIATLGDKVDVFTGLQPVPRFIMYNFNNLPEIWKDIRVRQAVAYAIDGEAITEKVYKNTHQPIAAQVLNPATWSDDLNWFEYDPDKARSLLAKAGVAEGELEMDVIGYKGDPMTLSAMQAVQSYLSDVGITFNHTALDTASYRAKFTAGGEWTIVYRGANGAAFTFDPAFLYSNGGAHGGDFVGYDFDPVFSSLVSDVATAATSDEFIEALTAYNLKDNELSTITWLWAGKAYGAASKSVKNFHWYPGNGGGPYMDHAELWTKE